MFNDCDAFCEVAVEAVPDTPLSVALAATEPVDETFSDCDVFWLLAPDINSDCEAMPESALDTFRDCDELAESAPEISSDWETFAEFALEMFSDCDEFWLVAVEPTVEVPCVPESEAESAVLDSNPAESLADCASLAASPAESAAEIAVFASSVGNVAMALHAPLSSVSITTAALVEANVVEKVPSVIVTVLPDTSESLIFTTMR